MRKEVKPETLLNEIESLNVDNMLDEYVDEDKIKYWRCSKQFINSYTTIRVIFDLLIDKIKNGATYEEIGILMVTCLATFHESFYIISDPNEATGNWFIYLFFLAKIEEIFGISEEERLNKIKSMIKIIKENEQQNG